jgi:hypothetical protein
MGLFQMPMRMRPEDCPVVAEGATAIMVSRRRLAPTANQIAFCESTCRLFFPLLD